MGTCTTSPISAPNTESELPITHPCSTCASGMRFFGRIWAAIATRPPFAETTWKTPAALCNLSRSTTTWRRVSITVTSDSGGVRNGPSRG